MIFGYFTLFVALTISAVAEFYSIVGLTSIFSAAFWPVVIMGASLGVGKVTAAVWLKLNWERASWTYKLYLVPAVAFLMLLTSMGIFGYLSKAHSDQSLVSGDSMAKVAIYDEKIKTAKDNIDANRKALKQLDEAVDQVMGRSTSETGADKAVAIRRAQQKERGRLLAEIQAEQKTIATLSEEAAPLRAEFRKVEAEVGPIKYIAALVYGDNPDATVLEKSVRLVIIMIVLVFDPLALVLILAAQQSLRWAKEDKSNDKLPPGWPFPEPAYEPDDGPLTEEQIEQIKESVDPHPPGWMFGEVPKPYPMEEPEVEEVIQAFDRDRHAYLNVPFVHFENLKPMVAKSEPVGETVYVNMPSFETEADDYSTPEEKAAMQHWKELNPSETLKSQRNMFERGEIDELPWMQYLKPAPNSSFGPDFPAAPARGDTFVRTDVVPNRLYKFNGDDWILVDKTTTDNYTYDIAYIDHLIDKIATGEYDPDLLNPGEQEQVAQRLQTKTTNT